ncbi:MAG: hypothetical protein ABI595_13340 [Actinomycetota bacterium]
MDGAVRRATAAALLTVVMVACGDGGTGTGATDATTSEASATASTTPQTTTEASPTPILSVEEQGCVDAFVRYLEDIEDVVESFDFPGATLLEYQDVLVKLVPAGQALADRVKGMRCDVLDGTPSEELALIIVDIARTEAPGSVPYLELLIASSELSIAGSCVKDIAALERYVDAGGTVRDVSVEERFHAFGLVASISAACSLMTGGRFLSSNEVERFLEIG